MHGIVLPMASLVGSIIIAIILLQSVLKNAITYLLPPTSERQTNGRFPRSALFMLFISNFLMVYISYSKVKFILLVGLVTLQDLIIVSSFLFVLAEIGEYPWASANRITCIVLLLTNLVRTLILITMEESYLMQPQLNVSTKLLTLIDSSLLFYCMINSFQYFGNIETNCMESFHVFKILKAGIQVFFMNVYLIGSRLILSPCLTNFDEPTLAALIYFITICACCVALLVDDISKIEHLNYTMVSSFFN